MSSSSHHPRHVGFKFSTKKSCPSIHRVVPHTSSRMSEQLQPPSKKAKTVADEITLVCAEGAKVTIPLDHAMQCNILAALLEDLPIAEEEVAPEIPVPAMPVCRS